MIESTFAMTTRQSKPEIARLTPQENAVYLTIVVPVLNEVENLEPLIKEIAAALDGEEYAYEVLFIDDGSTDGSFELLQNLHVNYPQCGVIQFRRNFGQTAAFAAGFSHANGQVIVTIDADRQNDPADIPRLVNKVDEGFDVVNGWRQNRQDGFLLRRVPSYIANRLIARSTGVRLHDRGCSLRAYRIEVAHDLHLYGEMHRFIPELASTAGFRMTEIPVNHRPRVAGTSKYGITRTFRVMLDLLTILFLSRYSARPMHLLGSVGIISSGLGILFGFYLVAIKVWAGIQNGMEGFRSIQIGDRPLLNLSILLVILGVQFIVMGLLAELIVRTYYESQDKPTYYIRNILSPSSEEFDAGG